MKKIILLSAVLFSLSILSNAQQPTRILRHVVMFKFKDQTTTEQVKVVVDAFKALKGKISLIKDFEWGVNNSPEKLNQGLTHCFFATFASEKDRDDYLVHPDHKAFTVIAGPHIDKVTVIDYYVEK